MEEDRKDKDEERRIKKEEKESFLFKFLYLCLHCHHGRRGHGKQHSSPQAEELEAGEIFFPLRTHGIEERGGITMNTRSSRASLFLLRSSRLHEKEEKEKDGGGA